MSGVGTTTAHAVAFGWGLSEATWFFVVPDAWSSWVALDRPGRGMAAAGSALAGALTGGAIVWAASRRLPAARSEELLCRVPGIDPGMIARAQADLERTGARALVLGPAFGVPYKIFVRGMALQGEPLGRVLRWSVPARAGRFAAVTGGVGLLGRWARARHPEAWRRARVPIYLLGWGGQYLWYFTRGPGSGRPLPWHREAPGGGR